MASRNEIEQLLRNQIEGIWGEGRIALIDETYAADVVDRCPIPGQQPGREPMKQVLRDFRDGLPDTHMTLHRVLAQGDWGVDFWTMTATHTGPLFGAPPSGRRTEISGIDMARVADGRIAELWHYEELFQMREQLGLGEQALGEAGAAPEEAPPLWDGPDEPGAHAALPSEPMTPREERNLALARRHIEEIWAKGNADAAYEMYAEDVVDRNPAPGQRPGVPGILDVLGWLRDSVPDLRMRIDRYLVDGDYAADRWTMRGTHTGAPLMGIAARGRRFEIGGMDVIRIRDDGLISDVWHVEEFERLRMQIAA